MEWTAAFVQYHYIMHDYITNNQYEILQTLQTYARFTSKNHMKSCEKQGFHSVQIIKENHTLISIFPTQ